MVIKAPISMRSNQIIRRFINNTLVPQLMLWGLKDGMSDEELDKEINDAIGKTMKEHIAVVKSGKFDAWDIEDLI